MDIIDLQSLFYVVSIVFMVSFIAVLLGILYVVIKIRQVMNEIQRTAVSKIASITGKTFDVRGLVGFVFSTFVLDRIRKIFRK